MVKIVSISRLARIVVSVDGGPNILITDRQKTEAMLGVYFSVGMSKEKVFNRLLFYAPKIVKIDRLKDDLQ